MAAGRYDITIEEGARFALDVTWNDKDGAAVDITGWGATFIVKESKGDQFPNLIKSTDSDDIDIDTGTDGLIEIDVPVAKTTGLDFSTGVYQLTVYPSPASPDSATVRLLEGNVSYSKRL